MLAAVIYTICIAILGIWGAVNLAGVLLIREAPETRQARLLGCFCGFLLALSLLTIRYGPPWLAVALAVLGLGSGGGWFYIIYQQSLHNTTM